MKSINLALVASLVGLLAACAGSARPLTASAATSTTTTTNAELPTSGAAPECTLACGSTLTAPGGTEDHHASAVANIDAVFASMHEELVACYRARVAKNPKAHASVTLDLVLNPDGTVRSVSSTGGAMLGDAGLSCIMRRVESATFAPVYGGGTLRAEVPLFFRRGDAEDIF